MVVEILIIAAANLVIGGLIGMTGIAGFLLPMLYAGYLHMSVTESLALSFFAFLISGVLGSRTYYKKKNLDMPLAWTLSAGSFLGALLGVFLNAQIPEDKVKILLYLVVLLSGISILLRKEPNETRKEKGNLLKKYSAAAVVLGVLTGAVCSMSGAGGPVLVMPLLVLFGVNVRMAVGTALFDSIFIAIPAGVGYFLQCKMETLLVPLLVSALAHGIGVYAGSNQAERIHQGALKKGIAVFSVLIAIWKLIG